jgi:hypothetical protein
MLVKVWNRNTHDHQERFRDKQIFVPAGSYVQMDYHDAIDFLGQFYAPRYNKGGQALPESFKKLAIDEDDLKAVRSDQEGRYKEKADKTFVCMMCNDEFSTKAKLIKHVQKKHKDRLVDPDEVADSED